VQAITAFFTLPFSWLAQRRKCNTAVAIPSLSKP